MVDGKEEKTIEEQAPPTPEPQKETTLTPEVEALIAKAKEAGKQEAMETYKGIQRTIAEKDDLIRELKSQPPTGESTKELKALRLEVAALADAMISRDEAEGIEKKPKSSRLADLEAEIKNEQTKEWNRQLSEFVNITKEVGKDAYQDPEFEDCRDLFDAGKPEKALQKARKIANQLKETKVPEEKIEQKVDLSKLSDEELEKIIPRERLEKISRDSLEKEGKIKQSKGSPSGSGETFQELEAKYIAGDSSVTDRYLEERRKRRL